MLEQLVYTYLAGGRIAGDDGVFDCKVLFGQDSTTLLAFPKSGAIVHPLKIRMCECQDMEHQRLEQAGWNSWFTPTFMAELLVKLVFLTVRSPSL
jgi:hypothetical protein